MDLSYVVDLKSDIKILCQDIVYYFLNFQKQGWTNLFNFFNHTCAPDSARRKIGEQNQSARPIGKQIEILLIA